MSWPGYIVNHRRKTFSDMLHTYHTIQNSIQNIHTNTEVLGGSLEQGVLHSLSVLTLGKRGGSGLLGFGGSFGGLK
jgi:hypothetical protein